MTTAGVIVYVTMGYDQILRARRALMTALYRGQDDAADQVKLFSAIQRQVRK
jgi:hypothetical protein